MPKGLRTPEHTAIRAAIVGTRKAKGLDQQDLAKLLGWSSSTISRIESGERSCSAAQFLKIARALKVPAWKMMKTAETYL